MGSTSKNFKGKDREPTETEKKFIGQCYYNSFGAERTVSFGKT